MNDTTRTLRVAVVGCGNIAGPYAETLKPYKQIELVGATDIIPQRAADFVAKYGGKAYASLDELLADESVDVVLNLTIHHAHVAVITQCLNAGKDVHSEKPLALTYPEAKALVELAAAKGLRLSCSPITFMGEAQQTAWKMIRAGRLGTVRLAYAEVNWGRPELWHPNPVPFYEVGPLFDVGVYPLTVLTTIFGPARRATAYGTVLHPDRVTKEGVPFHINTPDFVVAAVELANGTVARLTTNFYVGFHSKQKYEPVPLVREPYPGCEWGRALTEMYDAIIAGRPQRATGAQAAHVVEILNAIATSAKEGRPVPITSDFTPPSPMDWAT